MLVNIDGKGKGPKSEDRKNVLFGNCKNVERNDHSGDFPTIADGKEKSPKSPKSEERKNVFVGNLKNVERNDHSGNFPT